MLTENCCAQVAQGALAAGPGLPELSLAARYALRDAQLLCRQLLLRGAKTYHQLAETCHPCIGCLSRSCPPLHHCRSSQEQKRSGHSSQASLQSA